MKKKNIIILSIISTVLLGLTIFAGSKLNVKPKTLETNAETTNFNGAEIKFNDTLDITNLNRINLIQFYYDGKFYNSLVNENGVVSYSYYNRDLLIGYEVIVYDHYSLSNEKWINENYRTIKITSLQYIANENAANLYLEQNCELISRRPNTLANSQIKLNYIYYSSFEYTQQGIEEAKTYNFNFLNGNGGQYEKFKIYYYDDYPTNQTSNIQYIDSNNNINIAFNNIYDYSRERALPSNKFEANSRFETYLRITDGTDVTNTSLINEFWGNSIDISPYYPGQYTQEVIPLGDLMLQILTMPFTFINTAFDVTLWPGTPYSFNFKNFIHGVIAVLALLFIIKLFTSGFSVIGKYTGNVNRSTDKVNKKIKDIKPKDDN